MNCIPRHTEEEEHRVTPGVADSRLGAAGIAHSRKDP